MFNKKKLCSVGLFSPIPHCNQNTSNVFLMMSGVGQSFKIDMLEKYASIEIGIHTEWDLDAPLELVSTYMVFHNNLWYFIKNYGTLNGLD